MLTLVVTPKDLSRSVSGPTENALVLDKEPTTRVDVWDPRRELWVECKGVRFGVPMFTDDKPPACEPYDGTEITKIRCPELLLVGYYCVEKEVEKSVPAPPLTPTQRREILLQTSTSFAIALLGKYEHLVPTNKDTYLPEQVATAAVRCARKLLEEVGE